MALDSCPHKQPIASSHQAHAAPRDLTMHGCLPALDRCPVLESHFHFWLALPLTQASSHTPRVLAPIATSRQAELLDDARKVPASPRSSPENVHCCELTCRGIY